MNHSIRAGVTRQSCYAYVWDGVKKDPKVCRIMALMAVMIRRRSSKVDLVPFMVRVHISIWIVDREEFINHKHIHSHAFFCRWWMYSRNSECAALASTSR